ncbi:MAG: Gfo/Idh/MocA family oxidoreductase [Clostridia bacterium]|nr:Gfo/Idh/MocA family oxidoreductase [Clostridia bacterium]
MKTLKAIVIGAGNRGITYSHAMSKSEYDFQVVAVAEPIESRRNYVKSLFNIPDEMCFTDYKDLLELGKIADIAVIATMDRDHFAPAIKAIELKYDLLLEKPIAPTPEECIAITRSAEENGVKVLICTVLRYTQIYNTIKSIIDEGKLGKIMSMDMEERVGGVHQSHSFVRGNWGNSERSSVMLLQKSCHDLDLFQWLLGKKCKSIQSFGALSFFTRENAPEGAPEYCIEGCPHSDTCRFNAVKLYLDDKKNEWFRGACTHKYQPNDEDVIKAITETQYGKCVYKCDNDVVDHQTVNMLFEDDITVTFTMNAFNSGGRTFRIFGTKGLLEGSFGGDNPISLYNFETRETEIVPLLAIDGVAGGHGGGDMGIVNTMYSYFVDGVKPVNIPDIAQSCYNHLITFAAEESRLTNTVVDVEKFIKKYSK